MYNNESNIEELFIEKFEKLSLKIELLTDEVSKMKLKLDKNNKFNRSFGLKSLRNSKQLEFTKEFLGIGSPTKRYILSLRAITEEWKGRKNDILITIRQQEKETRQDIKALGIRIPIKDIKSIRMLTKQFIALLYISCELGDISINEILRETLTEINEEGNKMVQEIRQKMNFH